MSPAAVGAAAVHCAAVRFWLHTFTYLVVKVTGNCELTGVPATPPVCVCMMRNMGTVGRFIVPLHELSTVASDGDCGSDSSQRDGVKSRVPVR